MNLTNLLNQKSLRIKVFLGLTMVLAFIGFLDASYLTIVHFKGEVPGCTLIEGCEVVTTSEYAVIYGVPVSLLGSFYYLFILIASFWSLQNEKDTFFPLMFLASSGGIAFTGYLLYLMYFVLYAVCQYCLLSAATSTGIFIFMSLMRYNRGELKESKI